jgi:hypothetical protein
MLLAITFLGREDGHCSISSRPISQMPFVDRLEVKGPFQLIKAPDCQGSDLISSAGKQDDSTNLILGEIEH